MTHKGDVICKRSPRRTFWTFSLLVVFGLLNFSQFALSQTSISCGQTVAHATTTASEVDQYSYAGTSGQMLSIALWGPASCTSGGDTTVADIYNPSGQLVASLSSGCDGGAMNLTLTNSGTFTILVHESAYRRTVSYQMSIESVTGGGCNGTAIACGQTVATNTTFNSEMDPYSYVGTAGQTLSIALWGPASCTSGGDTTIADIYNSNGQLIASLSSGCDGNAMNLTLTNSGIFTILVHESAYERTVNYQMSIQSDSGGGCNGTAIACGQTVASKTTFNSEMDPYSYNGTAGQILSIALWGPATCTSGGDTTIADIYNPSGHLITSLSSGCEGAAMNLTLTNSGTFTILVHESAYQRTVSYQMSIQSDTDGGCDATAIACGQTIASDTTFYSEMDPYSYVGTAGKMLSIALWGPATCTSGGDATVADIYNPNGQLIASLSSGCYGNAMNLTLTNNGIFTILVHESAYERTVNYQMSVESVTGGGCNGAPIACGQTIATNTTFYSEMDPYSYVGTAGKMLSIALWGPASCTSGGDTTVADIYNPSGQLIASLSSGCDGNAMNLTLTNSGIFTILVHESAYRRAVSYEVGIQSITGGGCNGSTIPCGQTLSGEINLPSQMAGYELVANAGEHVLLTASGFSGVAVNIYDPTGSNIVNMGASTSTNYTFADTGIYTLIVHSGTYSGTGSYGLTETVFGGCATLPTVSVTPSGTVVPAGGITTFTALASGPTPLEYQWRLSSNEIYGATNSILTITDAQTNNIGGYVVVVSNPGGAVTSSPPALLAILDWTNPSLIIYGTPLESNQLNATATIPGTLLYYPPAGTVLDVGANILSVMFDPTNSAYSSVTDTVTLVVTPASLTILASNLSKNYGQTLTFTDTDFSSAGLVNGDEITNVLETSVGAAATSPVSNSPYAISITNATGPGLTNYNITYVFGALTVNPATLTVTANNASRAFDTPNPAFTVTYAGFVNGQTLATCDVSGSLLLTTVADINSKAGTYVINNSLGTLSSSDYTFDLINGTLTITNGGSAPEVTIPPTSLTNTVGTSANFTVAVGGTGPFFYQWSFDNAPIAGATSSIYSISDVQVSNAGTYSVVITNAFGATNAGATLAVPSKNCDLPPPGIVGWWPGNGNAEDIVGGNNGALTNGATYVPGEVGEAFGFASNSTMVIISNSSSLQLQNLTIEAWIKRSSATIASSDPSAYNGYPILFGYGQYGYALLLAPDGSLILSQVDVDGIFSPAEVIDTNWHHIAVTTSGGNVVFYVDGVAYPFGTYNRTYQFATQVAIGGRPDHVNQDNNDSFFGAIGELSVYNRALSAGEIQSIYAAGSAGKCTNNVGQPSIIVPPISQTNVVGSPVTFTVEATGATLLSYQWYFDSSAVTGATNSFYSIASVQVSNAGTFMVVVSNMDGTADADAKLTVATPPSGVTILPPNQTIFEGANVGFTATVSGTLPLAFQWAFNGTNIVGATGSTLTLADVQSSADGNYSVIVSNSYGVASNAIGATLNVLTFTVSHTSMAYASPGICSVSCQVNYALDQSILALVVEPALPQGWTLQSVTGDGNPLIDNNKIGFNIDALPNPIRFTYTIAVPTGQSGSQSITDSVLYLLSGMTASSNYIATPTPLVVDYGSFLSLSWQNSALSVEFFGDSGSNYILQTSSDLVHWVNVTSLVPVDGIISTNVTGVGKGAAFYRAVTP